MRANTKVIFLIGRMKGEEGVVTTKKGLACGPNEVVVKVGDERFVVNKLNLKKK
jgi:hypothetical protein